MINKILIIALADSYNRQIYNQIVSGEYE